MVGKIMKEDGSRIMEIVMIEDQPGLPKKPLIFRDFKDFFPGRLQEETMSISKPFFNFSPIFSARNSSI